jgi:predicted HAD superfamily Cof-like phosphohydrolase
MELLPIRTSERDWLDDIEDFHQKFGLTYEGKVRPLPLEMGWFRQSFMHEELTEYKTAASALVTALNTAPVDEADVTHQLEQQLDALIDLVYVALGTVYLHGMAPAFREGWRRVQKANMAKERALPDGSNSKRKSPIDVIKPPGWTPPTHTDLVEDHTYATVNREAAVD